MLLELVLLVIFIISLGGLAPALLISIYGLLLIGGTLVIGVLLPLILNWRLHRMGSSATIAAAVLALVGGLILRYAIVMAGQYVAVAGR